MRNLKVILIYFLLFSLAFACNSKRREIEVVEQGKALFSAEKYTEAIPYFTKAIKRNSANNDAYAFRGYCYFLLEDYSKATLDFSVALAQNQKNEIALFGDARLRWNKEDYGIAFHEFDYLIKLNPEHNKAYFYRGRGYLDQGDTINGLNDLSMALKMDSCFIDAYYLLSAVLTAQKKYAQADSCLSLALKCKQSKSSN